MAKYKWWNKKKSNRIPRFTTASLDSHGSLFDSIGASDWTLSADGTYTITLSTPLESVDTSLTLTAGDEVSISGSDIYINGDIATSGYVNVGEVA